MPLGGSPTAQLILIAIFKVKSVCPSASLDPTLAESSRPAEHRPCQAVAAGLHHNQTLVELDLAENALGAEGMQALSR